MRDDEFVIARPIKGKYCIGFEVSQPLRFPTLNWLTPDVSESALAPDIGYRPAVRRPTHTCGELKFDVKDLRGRTAIDRQNGQPNGGSPAPPGNKRSSFRFVRRRTEPDVLH